jgi:hypothetical protein
LALAPFFDRAALAAAQIISGFDEEAFRGTLEQTTVGISLDGEAARAPEGQALADLAVRLLARLYPRLKITSPDADSRQRLSRLATAINSRIELGPADAEIGIAIGKQAEPFARTVFAGSDEWVARVGTRGGLAVGGSSNPFGPGAAACLAAANVFRFLFLGRKSESLDDEVALSTWTRNRADGEASGTSLPAEIDAGQENVLVGLGAIGHGALWALARCPLRGALHLVDHESIELSNLQRYVLAEQSDEGARKTLLGERALSDTELLPVAHSQRWDSFVESHGHDWHAVAVAVDSARDRRAVQAALPQWIANAWTQPGDLGTSFHSQFGGEGACLCCLYLPTGPAPNEDELVASALGIPERLQQVRDLLHHGSPTPPDLLEAVAAALQVPSDSVQPFAGRTIRELYVDGLCGGAVIGLERIDTVRQDVHVPLAHQSALAGILLAAGMTRHWLDADEDLTTTTRIDVLRPLGVDLTAPARSAPDGRCICHDADYRTRHGKKWDCAGVG